jgi:hypothetical protein
MDPIRPRFGMIYEVVQEREESGSGFDLALPVLMVDWNPVDSREELFTADLRLPESHGVVEVFPTVPVEVQDESAASLHSLSLPVVPSFLRLRGREGPRPVLTFGRIVDLGVGLILFFLGAFGWRMMRRSAKPSGRTSGSENREGGAP